MDQTVNVLNVRLDNYTAKDAMKLITEYIETEPLNTIEVVTPDVLMRASEMEGVKELIEQYDMVIAGDDAILESAQVNEKKKQDVRNRLFLKMVFRYFHKNHVRIYLLADTEEEIQKMKAYFDEERRGIEIVGSSVVPDDDSADDMIINEINGAEVDCILAGLSSPVQEYFLGRCKNVLNAKIWLGIGKIELFLTDKIPLKDALKDFIEKKVLKRKIELEKKKQEN